MAHLQPSHWLSRSIAIGPNSKVAATLILVVLGSVVFSQRSPSSQDLGNPVPILATDSRCWDFGTVDQDPRLSVHFVVRNAGTRRLILNEKKNSCGCTSANESTIVIPPGSSRRIEAYLETRNYCGPVAVDVDYSTNDPRRPTLTYTLMANIEVSRIHDH